MLYVIIGVHLFVLSYQIFIVRRKLKEKRIPKYINGEDQSFYIEHLKFDIVFKLVYIFYYLVSIYTNLQMKIYYHISKKLPGKGEIFISLIFLTMFSLKYCTLRISTAFIFSYFYLGMSLINKFSWRWSIDTVLGSVTFLLKDIVLFCVVYGAIGTFGNTVVFLGFFSIFWGLYLIFKFLFYLSMGSLKNDELEKGELRTKIEAFCKEQKIPLCRILKQRHTNQEDDPLVILFRTHEGTDVCLGKILLESGLTADEIMAFVVKEIGDCYQLVYFLVKKTCLELVSALLVKNIFFGDDYMGSITGLDKNRLVLKYVFLVGFPTSIWFFYWYTSLIIKTHSSYYCIEFAVYNNFGEHLKEGLKKIVNKNPHTFINKSDDSVYAFFGFEDEIRIVEGLLEQRKRKSE